MDSYTILDCADPNFLVVGDDSCSTSSSNDGTNCNTFKSPKKEQLKQEQQVQNDWHLMDSLMSMVWSSTSTLGDDDEDDDKEGDCSIQKHSSSAIRTCQSSSIASFSPIPIESFNSEPLSTTYPPQYRSPYYNNNYPGRIKQARSLGRTKRCLTLRREDSIIYEDMMATSNNNNTRACSPPPMEAFMTLKPSFSYYITTEER